MPRSTKIFVGNIAIGTSSEELIELFSRYGQVTECDVLGVGNYAFVHMASDVEADTAIKELHNFVLNSSALNIERSTSETQGRKRKEAAGNMRSGHGGHSGIPQRNTTKIFVGNIKDGTTNDELRSIFEQHGNVSEADVCGGYGFVHMQSQSDAIKAIKALNGYFLNGNRLNIELSTEATQGRSSVPTIPSSRGGRGGLGRGRGNLSQGGKRYDPYSKLPIGGPAYRSPHVADPYAAPAASASYGYGPDPYAEYSNDPYGAAPRPMGPGAPGQQNDSFARDLLNLYIKNPVAFDKYVKDPVVRQSMSLSEESNDPYYRPPKEYYEAKNTGARSAGLEESYGGVPAESYAPIPKRPLLPIGSGRGPVGVGIPPRGPVGLVPMMGHPPMGPLGVRPRIVAPRPALYMSFE